MTLTACGDHNVLDVGSMWAHHHYVTVVKIAPRSHTHAESSCVDLAATLIVDSLLLLDLRPLVEDVAREVNRSLCQ